MRAARFYKVGEPLVLEDIPIPKVGEGEVLVRVKACSLCGSDLHIIFEGITPTPYQPITLGSEPAGIVEEIEPGVKGWSVYLNEISTNLFFP